MARGSIIPALGPDALRQVREQLQLAPSEPKNKFGATAVVLDGYRFASKREAQHYWALKNDETIRDLFVQPAWRIEINGEFVCDYVADFSFRDANRVLHVHDVKSKATKTPEYRIKRKLMHAVHSIYVEEIA